MPVAFFELRRQRYAHLKGSTNLPCWLMALKPLCSKKHSMVFAVLCVKFGRFNGYFSMTYLCRAASLAVGTPHHFCLVA